MNSIPWEDFNSALTEKASAETVPLTGTFELTPLCNFQCKMCYVRLDPDQMANVGRLRTAEEWISLGRQAADAGTLKLLLTGGEPFSRSDFRQIYEALIAMGFLIKIYSNASLITEEIIEWLSKYPPTLIRITLYGASNETYHKVCGDPTGFDKAVRGIELLKKANMPLALCSTITIDNEADIPQMKAFAEEHFLPFIYTMNVVLPVRGATNACSSYRLSDQEYAKCVVEGAVAIDAQPNPAKTSPLDRCRNGRCGFWVTWDGKLTLCSFLNDHFTHPFENGFRNSWSELGEILSEIQEPVECKACTYKDYCQGCIGVFSAETGHCDQISSRICHTAKFLYEAHENLHSREKY